MAAPDTSADSLLQAGRAALKQRDYAGAIPPLRAVVKRQQGTLTQQIQAEMGLVQAYRGLGEREQAIAHCQHLRTYNHPQLQDWVRQQLATLTPSHVSSTDPSGFTPLTDLATLPVPDPSGFTPLNDRASAPPADPSGFTPLTESNSSPSSTNFTPPENLPPPPGKPFPTDIEGRLEDLLKLGASLDLPQENSQGTGLENVPTTLTPQPSSETTSELQLPDTFPEVPEAGDSENSTDNPTLWAMGQGDRWPRPRLLPGREPLGQLWGLMALTLVTGVALTDLLWHRAMASLNWVLQYLDRVVPVPRPAWVNWDYTLWILIGLGAIALAAPWLLDWGLGRYHGLTPLALTRLKTSHPEAAQFLRQHSQQQGYPLPFLYTLPLTEPLLFSYGWWPLPLRIVVSQGLLDTLDGEELTALYARELMYFSQGTTPLFTWVAALVGGCHQVYWQLASWGERVTVVPLRAGLGLVAAIAYGLYWLGHKPALALARCRCLVADRSAISRTGHPAALIRAWIKWAQATAKAVPQRGYTHPLLESLDVLTPLGYRQALTLGSAWNPDIDLPKLLAWDAHHPYRSWLALNSAHPPLGYRIAHLNHLTRPWKLTPELSIPPVATPRRSFWVWGRGLWRPFSPYLGPFLGGAIALGLWVFGGVLGNLGLWQVQWLYGDQAVLVSSLYLGTGVGILLRLNPYFPDITQRNCRKQPALANLLAPPETLPSDLAPLDLQGTLIGRPGLANWLCQDLWLHTPQGLFKLHYFSTFGPPGNLLLFPQHPSLWLGQTVQMLGWFRRGADPWVDVDRLIRSRKTQLKGQHPLWSALLGLGFCGAGLWALLR